VKRPRLFSDQGIAPLCGPAVAPHGLDVVLRHTLAHIAHDTKGAPSVEVAFVGQHALGGYRYSHSHRNHKRRMRSHRVRRDRRQPKQIATKTANRAWAAFCINGTPDTRDCDGGALGNDHRHNSPVW
jgi:hypothetical protein